MRAASIAVIRRVVLLLLLLPASAASAQPLSGNNDARYVSAGYSPPFARYYMPYAVQAAAAYVPVRRFLGPSGEPLQDGSDIALAVQQTGLPPDQADVATKYLGAWRYQFGNEGYLRCLDSDRGCEQAIRADRWTFAIGDGPAFHVWARAARSSRAGCSEVSIAFRGTTGSFSDWVSNFQPVTGYVADDYYRQLRRNIGAIVKRIRTLDCYRRATRRPQIVSVGHSLGGGLAQMAALANPERPRIVKVFAFDPSPVTGAPLIDSRILARNKQRLEIDRIYQRGEALAYLRTAREQFPTSANRCDPFVRTVVYDVFQPAGAVDLHNMAALSRELLYMSYPEGQLAKYKMPLSASTKGCDTRYKAPAAEEYDPPPPAPDGEPGGIVRLERNFLAPRGDASRAYARSDRFSTAASARHGTQAGRSAKRQREAGLRGSD